MILKGIGSSDGRHYREMFQKTWSNFCIDFLSILGYFWSRVAFLVSSGGDAGPGIEFLMNLGGIRSRFGAFGVICGLLEQNV